MFVLAYWLPENEQTLTSCRILPFCPIYPSSCSFQDGPGNDHRLTGFSVLDFLKWVLNAKVLHFLEYLQTKNAL